MPNLTTEELLTRFKDIVAPALSFVITLLFIFGTLTKLQFEVLVGTVFALMLCSLLLRWHLRRSVQSQRKN